MDKFDKETPIDEIEDFSDFCVSNHGGNIMHRFRSVVEKQLSTPNYLSTIATHVKQVTNNLNSLMSKGEDYTLFFQMILNMNTARIMLRKELLNEGYEQYAAILNCKWCTQEVTDIKFDMKI